MRLTRGGRRSGYVDAGRFTTTTSKKISARICKEKSRYRNMHCPDWIASSGGKDLVPIRESFFSGKLMTRKEKKNVRSRTGRDK